MTDAPHINFRLAVRHLYIMPSMARALDITRAFLEVRDQMHGLLDSVDDVVSYQPAGRLIEERCKIELVAYLQGDHSALLRLQEQVKEAVRLLP